MLGFKNSSIDHEFKTVIHPDLRLVLVEFAQWCSTQGMKAPFITCLRRNKTEQVALYMEHWRQLQFKIRQLHALPQHSARWQDFFANATEWRLAEHIKHHTEEHLRAQANLRLTWHFYDCAADLRTVGPDPRNPHYSPVQLKAVEAWFHKRCPHGQWELKTETHGSGPHVHVARKDEDWKRKTQNPGVA
jgi:hypothetical protein